MHIFETVQYVAIACQDFASLTGGHSAFRLNSSSPAPARLHMVWRPYCTVLPKDSNSVARKAPLRFGAGPVNRPDSKRHSSCGT